MCQQTYGTGSTIDGAGSLLPLHRAGPLVDGTGRFIAGRAPLLDRTAAGAEPLTVVLLRLLLRLRFLAGVAAGAGSRAVVVAAAGTAVTRCRSRSRSRSCGGRTGVVVVQHDRQGAADVAQLTPKSGALAPGAFQLAVQPGAGRCVLLHHHAEFCLQTYERISSGLSWESVAKILRAYTAREING